MGLKAEIFEQPDILSNLLTAQWDDVKRIAEEIKKPEINYIFLAARGTSDNAGLYAKYLWGIRSDLPVALAAPSMFSIYDSPPTLEGAFVIGISQSGQSPDIISVLEEGKKQGAPTLAITNAPDSPLAGAAEHVIDIHAGVETAVAATKTFSAQLMAVAMLGAAMSGDQQAFDELKKLPEYVAEVLKLDDHIRQITERYRFVEQAVVLGRGYNYATAYEWSLKLKELTYIVTQPYSSADFLHGPIAVMRQGFPVFAVAPESPVFAGMLELFQRLVNQDQCELLLISDNKEALDLAHSPIPLPAGIPEWLTPLVSIVPAQLFAYYLTQIKGFNTESPRGITKVTKTE